MALKSDGPSTSPVGNLRVKGAHWVVNRVAKLITHGRVWQGSKADTDSSEKTFYLRTSLQLLYKRLIYCRSTFIAGEKSSPTRALRGRDRNNHQNIVSFTTDTRLRSHQTVAMIETNSSCISFLATWKQKDNSNAGSLPYDRS